MNCSVKFGGLWSFRRGTFAVFHGFESAKYDAVMGCNVLSVPGFLVDVLPIRLWGPGEVSYLEQSDKVSEAKLVLLLTKGRSTNRAEVFPTQHTSRRLGSQPKIKPFTARLYNQYIGSGLPRRQQQLTLSMMKSGAEMDLSG